MPLALYLDMTIFCRITCSLLEACGISAEVTRTAVCRDLSQLKYTTVWNGGLDDGLKDGGGKRDVTLTTKVDSSKEREKNCTADFGRKLHIPNIHLNYFNETIKHSGVTSKTFFIFAPKRIIIRARK